MVNKPSIDMWSRHYEDHEHKPFFVDLVDRMASEGPIIAIEVCGENAIKIVRAMSGDTDASRASPGTIRGDYGTSMHRNVIHTSEDHKSAARELDIWFNIGVHYELSHT